MDNQTPNPLPPKQPDSTESTAEEVGQIAVGSELGVAPEKSWLKTKRETSNPIVKGIVLAGTIAVIIGLLTILLNVWFGIFLILLGSACIIACIFLPIGANRH